MRTILGLVLVTAAVWGQSAVTAEGFAARAHAALPVEESYDFIRQHTAGLPELRRVAGAKAGVGEFEMEAKGWRISVPATANEPLRIAADWLSEYLRDAMGVEAPVSGGGDGERVIAVRIAGQVAGCAGDFRSEKDYRIVVKDRRVLVCGSGQKGAMYGVYHLGERISLRGAPILPVGLDTTRRSKFQARMVLSGLGWMEFPDQYLATLPRYGFDAIFCSIYRNANNAPGVGPHWDKMKEHKPGAMKDLIRRAGRYGISVYTPLLFHYTGTEENVRDLRKLARELVTEFPEIRGYVLLTEGFYYKKWFGAGGHADDDDLKRWVAEWSKAVGIAAEEMHTINPKVEVLPWEYNVAFAPDFAPLKAYVMTQLPAGAIPLLTFENGTSYELDGQKGWLRDYAINQVGPAEVTAAQLAEAKKRAKPFQAIYSKADTFASWQFGTFPYLPFPHQWHARYQALDKAGVNGTLESWSYGFKPNWVAEMRAWYCWTDEPKLDDLLRGIARREFGAGNEEAVVGAWKHFSEAARAYPDTGPNWGSNNAVATPLFFEKPKPRAMTLDHSWSDPRLWSAQSQLNPYWPYVPSRLILWPDFSNKTDAVERYIRFFKVETFQKYLKIAADEMEAGLAGYRAAALRAPADRRARAFREVLLAEQLQRMMRSEHAVIAFEEKRLALAKAGTAGEKTKLLDEMTAILREERGRTKLAWETARRDSRLGYEWEQDYIYTPETIEEKLKLIDRTLQEIIPTYRGKVNGERQRGR